MVRKIVALVLLGILGLSAELWINVIQDPGAEFGVGDWSTDIWEFPEGVGVADSARVNEHDSSRAYEGYYSFLTDTDKDPGGENIYCDVWCYQHLRVPKAISDIDTLHWAVFVNESGTSNMFRFYISLCAQSGKQLIWCTGRSNEPSNDTLYSVEFPLPDSGKWFEWGSDPYKVWTNQTDWVDRDTIFEVRLVSRGVNTLFWIGQEVSWDNIVLEGLAYYDYAAESIDSDETADEYYTPVATFANEGIKDDLAGMVYAEILDGEARVYIDSQEVDIPHESSEQVTFAEWTVPHDGSYTLRVYPILELDEYSADDTLEQALTGLGLDETHPNLFPTLEIKGSTIHYSLPQNQEGTLTLYDATGRRIERMAVTRSGRIELGAELPSGVYIVRLESGYSAYTGKVVLVR